MKHPVAVRFGENLSRVRDLTGLSQEDLGIKAGLHRTEISQLERGLRVARIDTLVKLAGALGVSTDDLLDGIAWEPARIQRGGFDLKKAED
ncbi:MAG: helix-turn-helix domain-containing protein [Solirubrobacterales bacterium]